MPDKRKPTAAKKSATAAKKAASPKAPARAKKPAKPDTRATPPAQDDTPADAYDGSTPLPRAKDETFAQVYLANGLNATDAYRTVNPKAKDSTASVEGARTLAKPHIAARVKFLSDARIKKFEVEGEALLRHAAAIALADHRHLSEYRYLCCRYCHGQDHKYHRTLAEFEADREKHERDEDRREANHMLADKDGDYIRREFDEKGGPGFNAWADPASDCPNCHGHGEGRTILNDTRTMPADAVILYAGMKEGKDGIEMKSHDKGKALDMLFRHKGLFEADNSQLAAATSPEALEAMAARMAEGRAKQLQRLQERRGSGFTGD